MLPHSADKPVFDSVTNNPYYGDERSFFDVKNNAIKENGHFCDQMQVDDGEILVLRVYVENSATDNLAGDHDQGPGVARGSTLRIYEDPTPSSLRVVTAEVGAANTTPKAVWDTIVLAGSKPFRLDLVGRIAAFAQPHPEGHSISSEAFNGTGGLIGANGPDGNIAPRYSDQLFIYALVRVTYLG